MLEVYIAARLLLVAVWLPAPAQQQTMFGNERLNGTSPTTKKESSTDHHQQQHEDMGCSSAGSTGTTLPTDARPSFASVFTIESILGLNQDSIAHKAGAGPLHDKLLSPVPQRLDGGAAYELEQHTKQSLSNYFRCAGAGTLRLPTSHQSDANMLPTNILGSEYFYGAQTLM